MTASLFLPLSETSPNVWKVAWPSFVATPPSYSLTAATSPFPADYTITLDSISRAPAVGVACALMTVPPSDLTPLLESLTPAT